MFPLQYVGIALATSISSWLNVFLMAHTLKKRDWLRLEKRLFWQVGKILFASIIMAVCLWILTPILAPYMVRTEHSLYRFGALILLSSLGAIVYLAVSFASNTVHLRTMVMQRLQKK